MIQISRLQTSDLDTLRQLFLTVRQASFTWLPADSFLLSDFDMQTEGETIWVARMVQGHLAGFISVWMPDSFIHHLFIHPEFQRQGVGTLLLEGLPQWGHIRYQLKCLTQNEGALAFYRKNGFTRVGSGVSESGDYLLLECGDERTRN